MKSALLRLYCLLLVISYPGCKNGDSTTPAEGIIEYDAVVVDQSNAMAGLAPNKMIVKFKQNKYVAEFSAGMGLFSMHIISDPEKKTVTQLVKILNKKFARVQDSADIKKENDMFPRMQIQPTNETKVIAGYKCKKAKVVFDDSKHTNYDIFYTDDINIDQPNWNNPYNQISGILMEYQLTRHNLEMRFIAKKVTQTEIDDAIFNVPQDYKIISEQEMNELFEGFN